MPLELIPILALIAMFVAATLLPINMGTLGIRRRLPGWHNRRRHGHRRHHRRLPQRPLPDPCRSHLSIRDRAEQRDGRSDGPWRPAARPRTGGFDPLGHVRHHRGADRTRSAWPRGRRHHCAHRTHLRAAVQDQRTADGHDGDSRSAGRWLLPDQHLRRHRQQHRREGGPGQQSAHPVPRQPVLQRWASVCCSSYSSADDHLSAEPSTTAGITSPTTRRIPPPAPRRTAAGLAPRRPAVRPAARRSSPDTGPAPRPRRWWRRRNSPTSSLPRHSVSFESSPYLDRPRRSRRCSR